MTAYLTVMLVIMLVSFVMNVHTMLNERLTLWEDRLGTLVTGCLTLWTAILLVRNV